MGSLLLWCLMITCYFGVPGCGKSTKLVQYYKKHKKKYKSIYSINLDIKGVTSISFDDLGKYSFHDSLILIDEITMEADNRDFKTFSSDIRNFFILHRHLHSDIVYATQNYENVDKKIRDLTNDLWYMKKSVVPFFSRFTTSRRIWRNITIDPDRSTLTLGYRFCSFIESLFSSNFQITYRPFYYKYFDSFDELVLSDREEYNEKFISEDIS